MLSQDINSLKEKFSAHEYDGLTLNNNEVTRIVECLCDIETQAKQLEANSIVTAKRLTQEHLASANLVIFPLSARPVASQYYRENFMEMESANDDGGDAA